MLDKIKKIAVVIIFNLIMIVILFLIIEGLSSSIIVIQKIIRKEPLAERLHTKYDRDLGWINIPNIYIQDMYGPGIYLRTNSQSFRNNNDFEKNIPKGKIRIICSGDSFTFGYGVDNDHTWCQRLVDFNSNLETVNMGQGGYGIDQAYLWFKRDSERINYDIHIFAFTTHDFGRMETDESGGYGKPILSVQNDLLITKNVPVPKRPYYLPWLNDNFPIIKKLHVFELGGKLSKRLLKSFKIPNNIIQSENQKKEIIPAIINMREVESRIFKDIKNINRTKNSIGILLFLPTSFEYKALPQYWKQILTDEAEKNNLIFIDLIDEFQKLPADYMKDLFIPDGVIKFDSAAGHYTEEGNRYIADILYKKMNAIREISEKLNKKDPQIQPMN